jgi:hypothetical protein
LFADGDGKTGSSGTKAADGVKLDDGLTIPKSTCKGNKKALLIGINYFGTKAELRGCINDVTNVKALITGKFNFPTDDAHMRVLTDDDKNHAKPTRAEMIKAFQWLVDGAKENDSLFLHYSGHGGSQKDVDPNTDEADGMDETWCPVDYDTAGQIVDDDLYNMLVKPLPAGVRLTVISDACHSASVLDTPFLYTIDGNLAIHEVDMRKLAIEAAVKAGKAFMVGDKAAALKSGGDAVKALLQGPGKNNADAANRAVQIRPALADVIVFSGCLDHQTSADATIGGKPTGAMSWALIEVFNASLDLTYVDLLKQVRQKLDGKFQQIPQMSSGSKLKLADVKFIM